MKVETVVVGPIEENCYIVECDGELMVVDPGDELERILAAIAGRKVAVIVATHRHWDHVGALAGLAAASAAPVCASRADAAAIRAERSPLSRMTGTGPWRTLARQVDRELSDGDVVRVGSSAFTVLETPGHTAGSICLHCPDEGVLFSGDTVFSGGRYGRTDFETGSARDMERSLRRLAGLVDDGTVVYCGHGQASTMGRERRLNPFMRAA